MAKSGELVYTDRSFSGRVGSLDARGMFYRPYHQPELLVGNALLALGNVLDQAAERQDRIDFSYFKTEVQEAYSKQLYDPETGAVNTRKGTNARGVTGLVDNLNAWVMDNEKYKNMPRLLRPMFDEWYTQFSTNERLKLAQFENQQILQGQKEQTAIILDNLTQQASQLPLDNADGFGIIKSQLDEVMGQMGELEGWSPEYTAMQTTNSFSKILANAAIQSPKASLGDKFLKQSMQWITPADYAEANAKIGVRLEQEYAKAIAKQNAAANYNIFQDMSKGDIEAILAAHPDYDSLREYLGSNKRVNQFVRMVNSIGSLDNKIAEIQADKAVAAVDSAVTNTYFVAGFSDAMNELSRAYSGGQIDLAQYEKQENKLNKLATNTVEMREREDPQFMLERSYVLSTAVERGLSVDELDKLLDKGVITGAEYKQFRNDVESGKRAVANDPDGKAFVKMFESSIIKQMKSEAKNDPMLLAQAEAYKTEGLRTFDEWRKDGRYDPAHPEKLLTVLNSNRPAFEEYYAMQTPETEGLSPVMNKLSQINPGLTTGEKQALIYEAQVHYRRASGGREPTDAEILAYFASKWPDSVIKLNAETITEEPDKTRRQGNRTNIRYAW